MRTYEERARNYLILVEGGQPSNYSAWSPELLGCVAVGDTIDECVEEMRGAIAFHLEGMDADGDPVLEGTGPGVYVAYEA